ncbi:MAG: hypothetical protein K9J42_10530 [Sulfuritalea sp.]|nr:hypothetical protein [Sulfuritalea sp.]
MLTNNKDDESNPAALSWLRRMRDSFRAWLKSNAEAHANAKPHACCSAPPPGAGEPPSKKEQ